MIKIALTGSIGMGKSTVAAMFAAVGIPVFDADAEVRRLQAEDPALIAAIARRFPTAIIGNKINRLALAGAVLGKPAELEALEAIVHPAVTAAREGFIDEHRSAKAIVFDIPLLFETGGEGEFDKVIVVSARANVQRRRVLQRPDMTDAKLDAILARQMPDEQKRGRADFVIDTGKDLSTTEARVRNVLACLGLSGRG